MTETTEVKSRKLIPTSQPISVLPTDIARLYTHLHPIIILTVYYFSFPYLVADPVSVLSKALAPLAHLQITYCVVCLPQSSGSPTPTPTSSKGPTTRKRVQFAQSAKQKPTTVGSRITVCYNPVCPTSLHSCLQLDSLIFCYPPNKACDNLSPPVPLAFGSAVDRHTHTFWRPFDYPFLAQPLVCNTYLAVGCLAPVLRARR